MFEIAEKIIELRLATRKACMCEADYGNKKGTLSLKTKILFLISRSLSPREIVLATRIAKTNLALLTKSMADEGLIVKNKGNLDKREVSYVLTEKGKTYLDCRLSQIQNDISKNFVSDEQYNDALDVLTRAIELLSD